MKSVITDAVDWPAFGRDVKRGLVTENVSQAKFCRSIFMSEVTLSRVINEGSGLSVPPFLAVCAKLGLDPMDYFDWESIRA